MASSFMRMSSASMFPYFCTMSVHSAAQSTGAGCNLQNHSFARPRRFSLAILNNLSGVRSRTSAAIVSRSAQSVTSSQSRPQNRSSNPCGLVISERFCNTIRMQGPSPPKTFSKIQERKEHKCKQTDQKSQLLGLSPDYVSINRTTSKSYRKLRLCPLMDRSQRFEIGRNSGELLLIRGFLLESPSTILIFPHPPTDESGSRSAVLHAQHPISFLQ
jgi:hypothetical protein